MSHFFINHTGWLSPEFCQHKPSPHFNQRPKNTVIDTCVLHNISLPPHSFGDQYVDALFLGHLPTLQHIHPFFAEIATLRVSAHFLIARNGNITQYVSTLARAWHAGPSQFQGRENCNDFSIGIEINGSDHHPYTLKQYQTCHQLLKALQQRHPSIRIENITTHSHVSPTRKTDPGPAFHLNYLKYLLHQEKNSKTEI